MNWFSLIQSLIKPVTDLIDKMHTSDEERMKAQLELNKVTATMQDRVMELAQKELESRTSVILAEAAGGFLQRNWRPLLMLTFTLIIFNNYVVLPYFPSLHVIEFPASFWGLLTVGTGGYIGARTIEKIKGVAGDK